MKVFFLGNNPKWFFVMYLFSTLSLISCSDNLEGEPLPELTDSLKSDSLKKSRILNIAAVTTQSTYWQFIDDNGIPFKAKGNMKIWVFPNPISEEEIDNKVNNGALGMPKINSNFTEKNFNNDSEIRKILAFNSVLWVKIVFNGSSYEDERTYTNMYYHYARTLKKPRIYQHYKFVNIDRQKGGF